RAALLQATLPPLAFIVVATLASWFVNAILMPIWFLLEAFVSWKPRRAPPTPEWLEVLDENAKYIFAGFFNALGSFVFFWPAIQIALNPLAYRGRDRVERYSAGVSKTFLDTVKFIFLCSFFVGLFIGLAILCGVLGGVIWCALIVAMESMRIRRADQE